MKVGILNQEPGNWAFAELAKHLAIALQAEIVDEPVDFNYVLSLKPSAADVQSFIPLSSIHIASDKRIQAELYTRQSVPTPKTYLFSTLNELCKKVSASDQRWLVKYPNGCGGAGHILVNPDHVLYLNWPRPYILQEFVEMKIPEVYRLYAADGELFGWNVRRFPPGVEPRALVSHAMGAEYILLGDPPPEALSAARAALTVTGLIESFGCVDLIHNGTEWLVLEVGTDGIHNYVDRDVPEPLRSEMNKRIAKSFWRAAAASDN